MIRIEIRKTSYLSFKMLSIKKSSIEIGKSRIKKSAMLHTSLMSSLARDGGTNLGHRFIKKFKKTLKTFIKWSQLLPETFEILLRPVWWATCRERQSPPSSLGRPRATDWQSASQQYLPGLPHPYFPIFAKSYFCTLLTYNAQH